jgi:ribosome-associated protein
VRGLSPVSDFFVIASGTSIRQMRAVCNELQELAVNSGLNSLSRSGYDSESWILVDFVDVIVHLFSNEARHYYDLDNLWGDAKRLDWQPKTP